VVTSAGGGAGYSLSNRPRHLDGFGDTIVSGAYDISQFIGGGAGNGLNYYDDNGASHGGNYTGQTFTTGAMLKVIILTRSALQTGNGGSSATTTAQLYHLFIYSVQGSSATLLAHYTGAGFSYTFGDWADLERFLNYPQG